MLGAPTHIPLIGSIMSRPVLDISLTMNLIEQLNQSRAACRDVITILQEIFRQAKSGKILMGVQVLQYCVKNCERPFHQAANNRNFQESVLLLLKRLRGKASFLKGLTCNIENWVRIEAKVLYLVQLWYDVFILEEGRYPHIIDNYKVLRKENVLFPPRLTNEKNLISVVSESPILSNIEEFAKRDLDTFSKKLQAMGMKKQAGKIQKATHDEDEQEQTQERTPQRRNVNIDEIAQKIAMLRSQNYEHAQVVKLIERIKQDTEYGIVKPAEEKYWRDVKQAADGMIKEWEDHNARVAVEEGQRYVAIQLGHFIEKPVQEEDQFGEYDSGQQASNQVDLI